MELKEDKDENESKKDIYKPKKIEKNVKKIKIKHALNRKRKRKVINDSEEDNNSLEDKSIKDENNNNNIKNKKIKNNPNNKIIPITKFSSLDPSLFSNEFITDYKCISCGLIPSYETAEESICCGYLFCEKCKNNWEKKKKGCPKCSISASKLEFRNIKNNNKIFYKSLKNFIIKCPYNCPWIGSWSDLESHLFKCDLSFRYCIYKMIGCEVVDESKKVKEHEELNNHMHLELALKFIKDKNIIKKQLQFELGEKCMTNCHVHPLTYCINRESSWICDGDRLELGCENSSSILSRETPRYRCNICNFDLCESCIKKYFINIV